MALVRTCAKSGEKGERLTYFIFSQSERGIFANDVEGPNTG